MADQKAKADAGKLRLTLVPRMIIRAIAHVRMYGVAKYPDGGTDNWRRVEVERYRDAACRRMLAYLDDPYGVDEESGLPHLWHLATNIAFLCDLEDEQIPTTEPETAKRIIGKSRDGMTLWYQCDMCNEPVDVQDGFCRGCGRRLTDE